MPTLRTLLAFACIAMVVAGCASTARTSLESSWAAPGLAGMKFKKIVILSVASDEFAQQDFQNQMAAALQRRGLNAVASERFFTHRSPSEDARFKRVVEQSGADAVLLARVVGSNVKSGTTPGTLIGPNGVPFASVGPVYGAYAEAFDPTHYVPPSDWSQTTVMVEALLYELKGRKAVWSARTRTTNAEQGDLDRAVAQFVSVLVGAMDRDGLF